MKKIHGKTRILLLAAVVLFPSLAMAKDYTVTAGDKLRISLFQWPQYSGESRVDESGTISLPSLGIRRLKVSGLDLPAIERKIVENISRQSKIADVLVVVDIAEYRPISVLGAVNSPGRYGYTTGTTVLEAVAMARGLLTTSAQGATDRFADFIKARERLEVLGLQLWGAVARRARLLAELNRLDKIEFPDDLIAFQDKTAISFLTEREEAIFASRKKIFENEVQLTQKITASLGREIKVLENHRAEVRVSVDRLEGSLQQQKSLVGRGLATRLTIMSVQGQVSSMKGELRRTSVSLMRTKRDLIDQEQHVQSLADQRANEIANELVTVDSNISVMRKSVKYQELLLGLDALAFYSGGDAAESKDAISFVIVRADAGGKRLEIAADENTPMMPGDTLKVQLSRKDNQVSRPQAVAEQGAGSSGPAAIGPITR